MSIDKIEVVASGGDVQEIASGIGEAVRVELGRQVRRLVEESGQPGRRLSLETIRRRTKFSPLRKLP